MTGSRALRSRAVGVTAVLALLAALWVPFAPAASAHDELVSSTPGDGDTVAVARSLTLTYSERIIQTGYRVVVRGPDGAVDGDVSVSGTALVQRFAQPLAAGPYTAVWRVVSADGHPVSGRLSFTVRGPAVSSASASASSTSSSASSSPSASSAAPTASASPTSSTTSGSASASDNGGQGRGGLALAGLAAVVVAAVAALGLSRRSRGTPGA